MYWQQHPSFVHERAPRLMALEILAPMPPSPCSVQYSTVQYSEPVDWSVTIQSLGTVTVSHFPVARRLAWLSCVSHSVHRLSDQPGCDLHSQSALSRTATAQAVHLLDLTVALPPPHSQALCQIHLSSPRSNFARQTGYTERQCGCRCRMYEVHLSDVLTKPLSGLQSFRTALSQGWRRHALQ